MLKSRRMKMFFLSALTVLFLLTWNIELMKYSDFNINEDVYLLSKNRSYLEMLSQMYEKKSVLVKRAKQTLDGTIEDFIVSYFMSVNTSTTEEDITVDKRELTTQFLFEASSNLSRSKNAQFSPIAHFSSKKASICLIPKNGHSVVRFVNCLFTLAEARNPRAYEQFNLQLTFKGAFSRTCNSIINSRRRRRIRGYKKIVFIRDPLERFISGWLFVCKRKGVCFNCGQDFRCFLTTLYNCWKTNFRHSRICRYSHRTRESPSNTSNHLYWHLSPQSSFCDLHKNAESYEIIEYSKKSVNKFLFSAADTILDRGKLENLEKRLEGDTLHAAKQNDSSDLKRVITSDRTLASMFAQLYYVDYETFGITIPQFIVDFQLYENG